MASKNAIENLYTLDVDTIRDYHVCELFYKLRYQDKLIEPIDYSKMYAKRYHETLDRVASYFFYRKQAGANIAYQTVVNKWEKIWFPKEMDAYDLAIQHNTVSRKNLVSYSNAAVAALEVFYADFFEDAGVPMSIKESFITPLRPDIHLKSEVDLILKYPDKSIKAIKWLDNRRHANYNFMGMEFAAMKFALEHHMGRESKITYHLYDLSSASRNFVDLPQPSQDDMKALLFWASEITESKSFVPRRGFTAYCRGCPFDKECQEFSQWPIKN